MGRRCSACDHADRAGLDRAIAAGEGVNAVADRYGLSHQAVIRHRDAHIPTAAMQAGAAAVVTAEAGHGASLVEDAAGLRAKAMELLRLAQDSGDYRTALQGVREAARCLELVAKLAGKLDDRTTVNVLIAPTFIAIQAAILAALEPYQDARQAVVAALGRLA